MEKIEIVNIKSLSRAPLVIDGYLFKGSDPKAPSLVIIGAMEGNSILPLYTASSIVDFLNKKIKSKKKIRGDVLIIPSINHYALNIGERFWPLDKTNLNMMFPGYDQGETTQRIAKKIFDVASKYDYAISLENRTSPANCIPYIKLFKSNYEDLQGAANFGFKIIHHKEMRSIDTVSLQYNLQLWGSKAYSIICPNINQVDTKMANNIIQAMIRFMGKTSIIDYQIYDGYESNIISSETIEVIQSEKSGIFIPKVTAGSYISKGGVLGEIIDSLTGAVIKELVAPFDCMILCIYNKSLIFETAVAFHIVEVG